MCFEFCSTSYLGTHTRRQRRDYTKQIFDFYNDNFPGISIYQDKNFKTPWFQIHLWATNCGTKQLVPILTFAQKTVLYRPRRSRPSTSLKTTVQLGSGPSSFGRTDHFYATVYFKGRPLSPPLDPTLKILEKGIQAKSNLMNSLEHF